MRRTLNILIIIPGFIPSTIIGVLRPLAALQKQGEIKLRLRINKIPILISSEIEWCDVAVFCRNCEIRDVNALYELKRRGKRIVYEIDDNFEEIPLTTDIGIYHRKFFRLHFLKRFFELSDVTRVYSERLHEKAQDRGAYPQLIKSYFDRTIVDGLQRRAPDGVIRIAYPTGRIDDEELEERIFSAVRTILHKYAGRVEFHLWRKSKPKQLADVSGVVLNKGVGGYEKFIRSFFIAGFDIGLAPGADTPFFHSKTNNKYREFGGCEIAGIYSNFPPYTNSVTHEYSGLLVGSSSEEWFSAIETLVLNSKLRARIVLNAANDVYDNYSFEDSIESWRECFKIIESQKSATPDWIPSSEKLPNYAFISLGHESEELLRCKYLQLSVNALLDATVVKYSCEEYLESTSSRDYAASVFFLSRQEQLQKLNLLLHYSVSAIIDITTYEHGIDNVFFSVLKEAPKIPVTFLATVKQSRESAFIPTMSVCILPCPINDDLIFQKFTLSGYPAAYLELIERHIRFSSKRKKFLIIKRLSTISYVIASYYLRWNRGFKTILLWVMWRLGFQKF